MGHVPGTVSTSLCPLAAAPSSALCCLPACLSLPPSLLHLSLFSLAQSLSVSLSHAPVLYKYAPAQRPASHLPSRQCGVALTPPTTALSRPARNSACFCSPLSLSVSLDLSVCLSASPIALHRHDLLFTTDSPLSTNPAFRSVSSSAASVC